MAWRRGSTVGPSTIGCWQLPGSRALGPSEVANGNVFVAGVNRHDHFQDDFLSTHFGCHQFAASNRLIPVRYVWIILILLLPACKPAITPQAELPRTVVCATSYPLADVVREIGGEYVQLDWILDLGDPITGYALSSQDRARMTGIDLLVCGGTRSEGWAQAPILSLEDTNRVVTLEQTTVARSAPATGLLWLDPMVVRAAVPIITDKLVERLPRQSETLRERAAAFVERLDLVVRKYPNSAFGRGKVLVTEHTFDALLDRFGVGSIAIETNALHLTENDLRRIRDKAHAEQIVAILLPFDTPGGAVQDIEQRTGLRVYLIDHLGLPQYEGHSTYLEMLEYNLKQLQAATNRQ